VIDFVVARWIAAWGTHRHWCGHDRNADKPHKQMRRRPLDFDQSAAP